MARILSQNGFEKKNIKLFRNSAATKDNVLSALRWMVNIADEQSEAVFFFSGDGGSNQIALWGYGFSANELRNALANLRSQKVFIAIQACYSGSLLDELEGIGRLVVSSATVDTVAFDYTRYSLWGYRFLYEGILNGKADLNGDGQVSMQEAYQYSGLGLMSDKYGKEFFL